MDYNRLGDFGASVLAVATAACKSLQVLDLESTGMSENGAKVGYGFMIKMEILHCMCKI